MKKTIFTLAVFAVFVLLSSCSSTMSTSTASTMSKMKAEPHAVWTRPIEMGFTVIGYAEGTADNKPVGDALGSKKVVDGQPSFFIGGTMPDRSLTPMMKLAAFNAIMKNNADGMYVTMAKEEDTDYGKKAWVKGVLLKLQMYGPVDVDRADKARFGIKKKHCHKNDASAKKCSRETSAAVKPAVKKPVIEEPEKEEAAEE